MHFIFFVTFSDHDGVRLCSAHILLNALSHCSIDRMNLVLNSAMYFDMDPCEIFTVSVVEDLLA